MGWRGRVLWRLWTRLWSIWIPHTSFTWCWSIWIWKLLRVWELFSPGKFRHMCCTLCFRILIPDHKKNFWLAPMQPTVLSCTWLLQGLCKLNNILHMLNWSYFFLLLLLCMMLGCSWSEHWPGSWAQGGRDLWPSCPSWYWKVSIAFYAPFWLSTSLSKTFQSYEAFSPSPTLPVLVCICMWLRLSYCSEHNRYLSLEFVKIFFHMQG